MNPPTNNLLDEAMITFEHYIQQACIDFTRFIQGPFNFANYKHDKR